MKKAPTGRVWIADRKTSRRALESIEARLDTLSMIELNDRNRQLVKGEIADLKKTANAIRETMRKERERLHLQAILSPSACSG